MGALPAAGQYRWKAGLARVDITPRESIWLAGYGARTKPSEGVLQPIYAKALALQDESGAVTVLVTSDLLGFTKELIALRRGHPVFRRRRYLTGKAAADLRWFTPMGVEMTPENWSDPTARSVALFINGATDPDVGTDGTPMVDDDFLILVNAWWEPLTFTVPVNLPARRWDVVCDTFDPARKVAVAQQLTVGPRSTVILQSPSSAASLCASCLLKSGRRRERATA